MASPWPTSLSTTAAPPNATSSKRSSSGGATSLHRRPTHELSTRGGSRGGAGPNRARAARRRRSRGERTDGAGIRCARRRRRGHVPTTTLVNMAAGDLIELRITRFAGQQLRPHDPAPCPADDRSCAKERDRPPPSV